MSLFFARPDREPSICQDVQLSVIRKRNPCSNEDLRLKDYDKPSFL